MARWLVQCCFWRLLRLTLTKKIPPPLILKQTIAVAVAPNPVEPSVTGVPLVSTELFSSRPGPVCLWFVVGVHPLG